MLATLLGAACDDPKPAPDATTTASTASALATTTSSDTVPAAHTAAPEPAPKPGEAVEPAFNAAEYRKLVETLSEPDGDFFSDNFISNETSYLQPTKLLASRPKGGAYIGVGPEQNFTYLAITEPELAFILDIRRDNLVLHLLYKAVFDLADSRSHFLALLIGADHVADGAPGADASIEEVLTHVERGERTPQTFGAAHDLLRKRIAKTYGIELSAKDDKSLKRAHQAFFDEGLDIRFELKENSTRKYPSLRELVSATDPQGEQLGFLATEKSFRTVQRMQRENRVIPVVGDFAGDHAVSAIAALLKEKNEKVRHFYVSNVEQYLLVDGKWWKWQRNIEALPIDEHSAFIRGYLDQGKRHPDQMEGHRTATILQPMDAFTARKKPYRSMWALCSDGVIPTPD